MVSQTKVGFKSRYRSLGTNSGLSLRRIYLVGFPERRLDREAESLANMICDAAPEAAILEHTYARHNDVPTINHTTPWDNAAESPVGGRRHRSPSQLTGELDFEEGHATTGVPPVSDTPG